MVYKRIALIVMVTVLSINMSCAQKPSMDWSADEKEMYQKLRGLAYFISEKDSTEIPRDSLYSYIEMDFVVQDTLQTRKLDRLKKFDGLFSILKKRIDSLGVENLDAKPIRYYKVNEIYKPFVKNLKKPNTICNGVL